MNLIDIAKGYAISLFGGAIVLWLVVDKIACGYLEKKRIHSKEEYPDYSSRARRTSSLHHGVPSQPTRIHCCVARPQGGVPMEEVGR